MYISTKKTRKTTKTVKISLLKLMGILAIFGPQQLETHIQTAGTYSRNKFDLLIDKFESLSRQASAGGLNWNSQNDLSNEGYYPDSDPDNQQQDGDLTFIARPELSAGQRARIKEIDKRIKEIDARVKEIQKELLDGPSTPKTLELLQELDNLRHEQQMLFDEKARILLDPAGGLPPQTDEEEDEEEINIETEEEEEPYQKDFKGISLGELISLYNALKAQMQQQVKDGEGTTQEQRILLKRYKDEITHRGAGEQLG